MSINYPPFIDEVLPVFYGNTIKVPFTMNQAVGFEDIFGFCLKIKTLQNNVEICNSEYYLTNNNISLDQNNSIIAFNLETNVVNKLKYPNSYKVQIGYIFTDRSISLLSNVGIIKYTTEPIIDIEVEDGSIKTISGTYKTEDNSEKLYSSYFIIKDFENNIFYQSEEKIHNSFNDDEIIISNKKYYVSYEKLIINKVLQPGKNYYVQFFAKSLNGIEIESSIKTIIQQESYSLDSYLINIKPNLNYDNGYIAVELEKILPNDSSISGKYKLARASSKDDFSSWDEILDFEFYNMITPVTLFKDFTIEQGITYKYALYNYNDFNFYSNKWESEKIVADFEDVFLYDGEKQLKIRFNSRISNLKNTRIETKVDTIGSKHPYIFRNGYVNYKEFSLSGVISLLADELNLFNELYSKPKTDEEILEEALKVKKSETDLIQENIYNERIFRDEVLEWLMNGQPKLFKSPTEGNFIVQLMNVSLSPLSDAINRMIYTFSSSVYEIEDYDIDNLLKNNYFKKNNYLKSDLSGCSTQITLTADKNKNFLEGIPGQVYRIIFSLTSGQRIVKINNKKVYAYDGYSIENNNLQSLTIADNINQAGDEIQCYYHPYQSPITDVETIQIEDLPCLQLFGEGLEPTNFGDVNTDLLRTFTSQNKKISYIYCIKLSRKSNDNTEDLKCEYYLKEINSKNTLILEKGKNEKLIFFNKGTLDKIYADKKLIVEIGGKIGIIKTIGGGGD